MPFTYDLTTDAGKVRMLIPDRPTDGRGWDTEDGPIFSDAEIAAFLALEENDVRRAAALGLETIASDNAMINKVIRLIDRATDGANASRALRERASLLREQAGQIADESTPMFDWAEQAPTEFAYRERMINEMLRNG